MEKVGRQAFFIAAPQKANDNGHGGDAEDAETQIQAIGEVLENALRGDFSVRINGENVSPPLRSLAAAVNETVAYLSEKGEISRGPNPIFHLNPLPLVIVDSSFKMLDVNRSYEELMQQSRDRLMRMEAADYKIKFVTGEKTEKTFTEQKRTKCELELTFKDGTKKIVEQYGIPLDIVSGDVKTAFFVYNDITKQREEEREIQKQLEKVANLQRRSEIIVQQNPMPMLLLDTSFKILVSNDAYVKMSGIPMEKILSMNARDFRVTDQKGEGLKQVIQQKKRSYGEVTVDLPSGVHILEQYGIPVQNEKGDLTNILIVYNDITERRKKESEIQQLMDESKQKSEMLAASARDIGGAMAAVAKGDLTRSVETADADPLATVKSDYIDSITAIRSLLQEVTKAVRQVENTTHDVSRSTLEIGKATEQVACSTQQSSEYARKQLEQIEAVGRDVSDLSASIEEIASTSHEVMERSQQAVKEGTHATVLGAAVNAKMQAVEKIAKQSVDEINRLNEQMREISNIVKLITDIANQTNLLALNAAIEAARAGEHGRGFAVVAGEVRNLAGEAKKATQHIEDVISGVKSNSDRTATSMKTAYSEISSGIESVNQTIDALNRIIAEIGVVAHSVTEISRATEDQANATNRVMERMEETTRLTKENMSQIEDMAALAQEVNASTEEVNSASQELSGMAAQLKGLMEQFTLN
jgi:methyl-accepting chemotaxis protein